MHLGCPHGIRGAPSTLAHRAGPKNPVCPASHGVLRFRACDEHVLCAAGVLSGAHAAGALFVGRPTPSIDDIMPPSSPIRLLFLAQELEFTIHADGRVEERVKGVKGANCQGLTQKLEAALGEVRGRFFFFPHPHTTAKLLA